MLSYRDLVEQIYIKIITIYDLRFTIHENAGSSEHFNKLRRLRGCRRDFFRARSGKNHRASRCKRRGKNDAFETETKFPVSVLEFVLSGRFARTSGAFGWETENDLRIATNCLNSCDLENYELRKMNQLSGGERQRVVLARALATEAKILLLDEPTANLDLAHQAMTFRLVREQCKRGDSSAIVITHDLNLAAEFADEILLLKNGKISAKGAPEKVLTEENIKGIFGVKVLLDQNPSSGNVRVTTVF